MGLTHAPICRICGERKTKRENQICSQCARRTCTIPCKVCGNTGRRLYDGICASCRNSAKVNDSKAHLDEMIADEQKTLLLLVELREGLSYRDAAKIAGLSTTAAFMRVKSLLPDEALDFLEVDKEETTTFQGE